MKSAIRDLRFLLRQFARRPLLYLLVIVILALGIGANTAMFSLTDAVLYRDLAVRDPDTLVRIFSTEEKGGDITNGSWPEFAAVRDEVDGIRDAAAYSGMNPVLAAWQDGEREREFAALATGNIFELLGIAPAAGRLHLDADGDIATPDYLAVLDHHAWRTRFDADPGVIGRSIVINDRPFTIVGVLPADFSGLDVDSRAALWLPLSAAGELLRGLPPDVIYSERFSWLDVVARLAPGVDLQQLQAELDARAQPIAEQRARQTSTSGVGPWKRVLPAASAAVDPYGNLHLKRNAILLTAVVGLVLLLACANVSALLAVRAEERARELAVRASIGASRAELMRMMLAETLALAIVGAVAGFAFAQGLLRWVVAEAPHGVVLPLDPASALADPRVLAVTTAVAMLTTLFVGVAPALRAARLDPDAVLKGAASGDGRRAARWRAGLVALQIGVCAVILVGAGLLLRSFWNTLEVDPGFNADNAVTVAMDLSAHDVANGERQAVLERIRARVLALPGVEAAGFSQTVPVQNSGWRTTVQRDESGAQGSEVHADLFIVSPGLVDALGVRLLQGRDFAAADMALDAAPVVLVNEVLARTLWPDGGAIGKTVANFGDDGARVVGVVAGHKTRSVHELPQPAVYATLPLFQSTSMSLVVRADRDPLALLPELRAAIREVDPRMPLYRERTLREHMARSYAEMRTFAWLLSGFALLALLLAGAGLYGMLAHVLRIREREFGIRAALGASRANIATLIARQVGLLVGAGLFAGLPAALFASRLLEGMLFGISTRDVATFAVVVTVVVAVALLAAIVPARRAANVEPMDVLREE